MEANDAEEHRPRHLEVARELLDHAAAVVGALLMVQLGADDALTDLPVGLDLDVVDGLVRAGARRLQ